MRGWQLHMGTNEGNDLKSCDWGAIISLWKKRMNLFEFEAPMRRRGVGKSLHEEDVGFGNSFSSRIIILKVMLLIRQERSHSWLLFIISGARHREIKVTLSQVTQFISLAMVSGGSRNVGHEMRFPQLRGGVPLQHKALGWLDIESLSFIWIWIWFLEEKRKGVISASGWATFENWVFSSLSFDKYL